MRWLLRYSFLSHLLCLAVAILALGHCASSKSSRLQGADAYFEEGRESLEHKRCVEAVEKFQRLVNNFPGSPRVPDAQYYLAEAYFCSEDYVNAVFEYQRLLDTYPSSEWLDEAQFKIAESYFKQVRRPELDQKETREALNYFRFFIEDNPGSPLVEVAQERVVECRSRLAQKQYLSGRLYQHQGHLEAARMAYEEVVRDYPDTPWYYHSLLQLGELAAARGEIDQAQLYWAEVVRDSEEEGLRQQAQEGLIEMQEVGGK